MWPNGWMDQDATWHKGRTQPRRLYVSDGDPAPSPQLKGLEPGAEPKDEPPIFGSCLLWPNGWMDQYGTWHVGRPWSRPHCARWDPAPLEAELAPIFGPSLLWPNGWMHQDATWYGCRPQPRRLCVRWGPRPPTQKGRSPQF